MFINDHKSLKWLLLSLIATAVIILFIQLPLLNEPEYVDEDLRFFYWLHRFSDPELFQNDPLLGYQFAEIDFGFTTFLFNKVSLMYGMLYGISSKLISPFIFSKILIFPLALISSYYMFRIGERLTSLLNAFILCIIFTLIVALPFSSISLSSGLPRAFTLPLLLATLYYMMRDNHLAMGLVLIVSLFYPPIFLAILITYTLKFGVESIKSRRLTLTGRQLTIFAIALLISILLLLPAILTGLNTVPVGPGEEQETTVFESPLFGEEGRYPLLAPYPLTANGGLLDRGMIGLYTLIQVILLVPIALVLRRKFISLPSPFLYLMIASFVGFSISWLAILFTPSATFHMPSRYMRGTIFLTSLILFSINGPVALQAGSNHLVNNRRNLGRLLGAIVVIGLLLVLFSDVTIVLKIIIGVLIIFSIMLVVIARNPFQQVTDWEKVSVTKEVVPVIGNSLEKSSHQAQTIMVSLLLILPLLIYAQGPNKLYHPQNDSRELVSFMKALPQNIIVSGYPCFLNDIPLYSQRSVLFSCETESRNMEMMMAAIDAYFSETPEEILDFCSQYNVDYLVGSPETFTEDFRSQENVIFEPLNSFLKKQLAGRTKFALEQIPDDDIVFRNDSFFVVPCTNDALASVE